MGKKYSKIPKIVSVSSKGKKSNIYRITVDNKWDIRDVFISERNGVFDIIELKYETSIDEYNRLVKIPLYVETIKSFTEKNNAVNWLLEYIRENALTFYRVA